MKPKQALVTGGAGFVGRHFCHRLVQEGYHVTCVDDLSTGLDPSRWMVPLNIAANFQFFKIGLREFIISKYAMANEYDLIVHCAAVVGGRMTIEGDPLHVATDLAIDSDFFNWCVASARLPGKVIYFSSSAVYPVELQTRAAHCRLSEDLCSLTARRIAFPDMTYGWAKLTGELLCKHATEKYGLNVVIYRPFSGYGEDQDPSYPFPAIMRRVVRRDNPLVIWGSGDQRRDFIHIDDVVDAVMETRDKLPAGAVLNLGTGESVSFRDLAQLALNETGANLRIKPNPNRPEGVFCRVADPHKLSLLYKPKVGLVAGINRALEHIARHQLDKEPEPL